MHEQYTNGIVQQPEHTAVHQSINQEVLKLAARLTTDTISRKFQHVQQHLKATSNLNRCHRTAKTMFTRSNTNYSFS